MDRLTIALDVMGGDHGPKVVVPAALNYLRATQKVDLILVGKEEEIAKFIPAGERSDRLSIRHASQEVAMNELPSKALRQKKDSSMRVAIELVGPVRPMPASVQATLAPSWPRLALSSRPCLTSTGRPS